LIHENGGFVKAVFNCPRVWRLAEEKGNPCGGGPPAIHSRTRRMMSCSIVGDRAIAEGGRLNQ
jgi:hypothetical protein